MLVRTYGAEDLRMAQGQLHELANLRQLLVTTSDVVVAELVQALVLGAAQRLGGVEHDLRVGPDNAVILFGNAIQKLINIYI